MTTIIDLSGNVVKADGFDGPATSAEVSALTALTVSGLTGTADGTIEDVTAVSTAGGNTYADSAINDKITLINDRLKELATKLNAVIAALQA